MEAIPVCCFPEKRLLPIYAKLAADLAIVYLKIEKKQIIFTKRFFKEMSAINGAIYAIN